MPLALAVDRVRMAQTIKARTAERVDYGLDPWRRVLQHIFVCAARVGGCLTVRRSPSLRPSRYLSRFFYRYSYGTRTVEHKVHRQPVYSTPSLSLWSWEGSRVLSVFSVEKTGQNCSSREHMYTIRHILRYNRMLACYSKVFPEFRTLCVRTM